MPKINKQRISKEVFVTDDFLSEILEMNGPPFRYEVTVPYLIKELQALVKEHGDTLFMRQNPWDDSGGYDLYKTEVESDEEYEKRMKVNEKKREYAKKAAVKRKKMKEEQDLKEWGRLKKKFGKGWK